ncbi:MAG: zinc-ribbon domain-containing protein [Candidatus Methanoplasma sp.]|jgi:hypothetical protein|nr:zinc-ribbon domain-containing protein [Candidatus Methanoplasma sp.]
MFCPRCGSQIIGEYAKFCHNCGHALPYVPAGGQYYPQSITRTQAGKRSKVKDGNAVAIVAIFIVLMLAVVGVVGLSQVEKYTISSKEIETQAITDDTYFELSGDFLSRNEVFTVSLTNDGKIAFTLNDSISSKYAYYSWWLFDKDHVSSTNEFSYTEYTGERLEKTQPVLYYLSQKPGEYSVSVDCYTGSGGKYSYAATYSGTVTYVGYITKEYAWEYKGSPYSAQVTFKYDEYSVYRDMKVNSRAVIFYSMSASFVTYDNPVIVRLAISLLEAYGIGRDTTGPDFASFVLAFVQICFDYPPNSILMDADKYQYGQKEYFAYPLETIFHGMGDCEDMSILAASLFKILGYKAGIVILPGHALAAVGLEGYMPEPKDSYEIIAQSINGVIYYACEVTADSVQEIGLIDVVDCNGHPYSWHVGKNGYGFYTV